MSELIQCQDFAIASSTEDVFRDIADWFKVRGDLPEVHLDGISFDSGQGEVRIFFHRESAGESKC